MCTRAARSAARGVVMTGLVLASASLLQGCSDNVDTNEVPEDAFAMVEKCDPNYTQGVNFTSSQGGRSTSDYYCTTSEWNSFANKFGLGRARPNDARLGQQNFHTGWPCLGAVVWFYPKEDHNGAFGINENVCSRLLKWANRVCGVFVYHVNSVSEATGHLDNFNNETIKHAVLGGHGSGTALHWGSAWDGYLEVGSSSTDTFLAKLAKKMINHGSIFTDSCLSATPKYNPNLAKYVAGKVGNGLRVIGSKVSFGPVWVTRHHAWNADIKVRGAYHQETYFAANAKCPLGAISSVPDSEGNCQCSGVCLTDRGTDCPRSGGLTSASKFLPICADSTALVKCQCYN